MPASSEQSARSCQGCRAASIAVLLVMVTAGAIVGLGLANKRAAFDQDLFHLRAIDQFAAQLPFPDLRDYPSATTPGYHLFLAAFRRIGATTISLRLICALLSSGLAATLAWAIARRLGSAAAMALTLPLLASLYFVTSAAWLLPDNLAWWGVLGGILLALRPPAGMRWYASATALLVGLVIVRQSNLWVAAPIWISAALGLPEADSVKTIHRATRSGMPRRVLLIILATLPAILLMGYFLVLWHGLTTPMFQFGTSAEGATAHAGGHNLAVPAFILSLVAGFGLFHLPLYSEIPVRRKTWRMILLGCVLGLILGVIPHTSYDYDAGRRSGLWELVGHLPVWANRSPLIVLLSTMGGGILMFMVCMLGRRERWILAGVWTAFILAQTANRVAWQRYYEPFILMILPLMLAMALSRHQSKPTPWAWLGPGVLFLLLAGVTAASMHR